eukprot:3228945-Rhodomonas_salina.1
MEEGSGVFGARLAHMKHSSQLFSCIFGPQAQHIRPHQTPSGRRLEGQCAAPLPADTRMRERRTRVYMNGVCMSSRKR